MDKLDRCPWGETSSLYQKYHDDEWGVPVFSDRVLFEKLCLESFQSGLSWITILKKRESFRSAFDQFDWDIMANYNQNDIERLVHNADIIRNCMAPCVGKVEREVYLEQIEQACDLLSGKGRRERLKSLRAEMEMTPSKAEMVRMTCSLGMQVMIR